MDGMYLNLQIAVGWFGTGNYSMALRWLNRVLTKINQPSFGADTKRISVLFNLILHFELQNYELLSYHVRSAYRYLRKKQTLYRFEEIILDFIRSKLPRSVNLPRLRMAFIELKNELLLITGDENEKELLEGFHYISWLESKIENRPFAEIVKEKIS